MVDVKTVVALMHEKFPFTIHCANELVESFEPCSFTVKVFSGKDRILPVQEGGLPLDLRVLL